MSFILRPFEPNDSEYQAAVAVENAVWPEFPDTVEHWKHNDHTRPPQYLYQRYVAVVEGQVVGVGSCSEPWWSIKPGKFHVQLSVLPDFRGRGIGAAFYELVLQELADRKPTLLTTETRENQEAALRFLARLNFETVMRAPVSYLDLTRFDPNPFVHYADRAKAQGIVIRPLSELSAEDPEWKRKYWELDWEIMQDVPAPDPPTRIPLEEYEPRFFGHPHFLPEGQFIALEGAQWVGMSGLWRPEAEPHKLVTGLTGVRRGHRRRGIAMAMKLAAIDFARGCGVTQIETDNEEGNPMFQINLRLGFEPAPALLIMEKRL